MIIQNGYIESVTLVGGGLDETTGHPLKANKEYGELIPCQFYASRYNAQAKSNGEPATSESWVILIENLWDFDADVLRLQDMDGKFIKEFSILRKEPLDAVGQIRITV